MHDEHIFLISESSTVDFVSHSHSGLLNCGEYGNIFLKYKAISKSSALSHETEGLILRDELYVYMQN